jgi:hypothetical protein
MESHLIFKILILFASIFIGLQSFASPLPFDFLMGRWSGNGVKGTTVRKSSECNYVELGKIGIINAKYVELDSQKVHLEYGVLAPTNVVGRYKFGMVREDATTLEGIADIDSVNQVGVLNFSLPPNSAGGNPLLVRYTITVADQHWLEIGEISTDLGRQWKKIYEMNLTKVSSTCAKGMR